MAGMRSAVALLVTLVTSASLVSADERAGLARLRQVSVGVEIAHPLSTMTAEDLVAHLVSALRDAEPPLTVQDGLAERLRLTVSVRPMSATTLRGFWLPFSGTYGIGTVRLGVERPVSLPGTPRPFPAVVWQTERTVGAPWHATDREIARSIDDMTAELLAARRPSAR